jgi:hypothetical protein
VTVTTVASGQQKGRQDRSRRPILVQLGEPSGRRRDLVPIIRCARLAGTAAGLGRLFFRITIVGTDRGRKNAKRDPLLSFFVVAAGTVGAGLLRAVAAVGSIALLEAVAAAFALIAAWALAGLSLAFVLVGSSLDVQFLFALILVILAGTTLALLILEARAAILEHAKIMIGILEIIFGLDPVAGELRIARQALVFFQQLGGVAALAVILAVAAGIASHALRTLSAAATTTAALTIVDQVLVSLSHWRRHRPVA